MTTTWKSSDKDSAKQTTANNTLSGTTLSSWSRQQKLAMTAGFAILGLLLAVSACSKQSPKPALVGVSSPAPNPSASAAAPSPATTPTAVAPVPAKKTHKKRPANVTYSDPNSGVSFLYPRKFVLTSGENAQPQQAGMDVPMNFVQPGGVTVATVTVPGNAYPGTDLTSAFFNVNVNRSISEQECSHFAFVDTRNADGEPVDAEKVMVGSTEMEKTADFSANALAQHETQYFHNYENGACYEYVLGLSTAGFGTKDGFEAVSRDEVFAKLEKILATVKLSTAEQQEIAVQAANGGTSGKE